MGLGQSVPVGGPATESQKHKVLDRSWRVYSCGCRGLVLQRRAEGERKAGLQVDRRSHTGQETPLELLVWVQVHVSCRNGHVQDRGHG